jgi:hypothetical protein
MYLKKGGTSMKVRYFFVLFFIVVSLLSGEDSNYVVHLSSETTQRLMHFSNKYDTPLPRDFYTRPCRKQPLVDFLQTLQEKAETSTDKILVTHLLDRIEKERTIYSSPDTGSSQIHLNFINSGTARFTQPDSIRMYGQGTVNPQLHGNIHALSFYSDISIWTEFDTDTTWKYGKYNPYEGIPYNLLDPGGNRNIRTSDIFRAGITFSTDNWLHWRMGVDYLTSGPARFNPLLLNASAAPFTHIRADLTYNSLRYTQIAGQLRSLRRYNKYINYHRLDFPLRDDRIVLGFNETIVYGSIPDYDAGSPDIPQEYIEANMAPDGPQHKHINPEDYPFDRSIEPIYLIPFVPFVFAEHFNGDRDKVTISMDALIRFPGPLTLYGEFLLDDLSTPFTIFSDDWRNKWAFTAGGSYYTDLLPRDLILFFEYTRVEPWVYTHFRGASHRHTHFGHSLGAEAGPNSDQLNLALEYQVSEKQSLFFTVTNTRTDRDYRGGHINHIYITNHREANGPDDLTADSDTKTFLKNPESEQTFALTWDLFPYHFFEMSSTLGYSSDFGEHIELRGAFNF